MPDSVGEKYRLVEDSQRCVEITEGKGYLLLRAGLRAYPAKHPVDLILQTNLSDVVPEIGDVG